MPVTTGQSVRSSNTDVETRPWLPHYPEGVPWEVEIPRITLVDQFHESVEAYPDQIATIFYGSKMTYAELDRQSNRFANQLIALGHQPGERVMLALPNVPQFLIAAYGILKAGCVVAALNPLLTQTEFSALAKDSGARAMVLLDRFWDKVQPLHKSGDLQTVIVTGVEDGLSGWKRLLYPVKNRDTIVKVPTDDTQGIYQFRDLVKRGSDDAPGVAIDPGDTALFQYTGGTTGLPRAVVLSHANLVANSSQVAAWIPQMQVAHERVMAILPFFHAYGGTLCLFMSTKMAATKILIPRFDLQDVLDQIKKERPTVLPGVPTLYTALSNAVRTDPSRRDTLRSIQYCISGGAPLPAEVQRQFEEAISGRLVEGYGLTEASPVTHANPIDGTARAGTIGVPLPNTEARIINTETGELCPAGERGELQIRGPQIMQGYWNRPEETEAVLSDDGWLSTGDVGIMDEDGYFKIVDRLKDIIITGGMNLFPREIEDVLYQHPKIVEVAVIGVDHEAGGQVARAYIVLKGNSTLSPGEIRRWTGERLAKYKIPRQFVFRDELPKSASGKILRRVLKNEAARERK